MDIKNTLAKWYKNRSGTDSVFRSTSLEFPEILIDQCIKDGYDVEVDVRYDSLTQVFWLGHDEPQYQTDLSFAEFY